MIRVRLTDGQRQELRPPITYLIPRCPYGQHSQSYSPREKNLERHRIFTPVAQPHLVMRDRQLKFRVVMGKVIAERRRERRVLHYATSAYSASRR
jgi:hypothetical protein